MSETSLSHRIHEHGRFSGNDETCIPAILLLAGLGRIQYLDAQGLTLVYRIFVLSFLVYVVCNGMYCLAVSH